VFLKQKQILAPIIPEKKLCQKTAFSVFNH